MAPIRSAKGAAVHHAPLVTQLRADSQGNGKLSVPGRRHKKRKIEGEAEEDTGYDLSERILELAKEQQKEVDDEIRGSESTTPLYSARSTRDASSATALRSQSLPDESGSESESADDEEETFEELDIDERDQAILDTFAPANGPRNLADIIMAKIDRFEAGQEGKTSGPPSMINGIPANANPKIVEVYTKVGQLLSRYKSGPLPKAFKILPTLQVWPSLLALTEPDRWTPHAALAATRIFASTLDTKQCQRFFHIVLYERIRDEIAETKKLSVQSYQALKKALYKPAAFFKGVLFPLCESGTCTLKEAVIIGSVLAKVSVPVLHSGAALLRLAEMEYSGPTSLFIRVLLDKKYALPYKVVDALVFHFLRFKHDTRELPVLWHQAFLAFAQRYKTDMTPEQKEALFGVLRVHTHHQMTAEIRRELSSSRARGQADPTDAMEEDVWV